MWAESLEDVCHRLYHLTRREISFLWMESGNLISDILSLDFGNDDFIIVQMTMRTEKDLCRLNVMCIFTKSVSSKD